MRPPLWEEEWSRRPSLLQRRDPRAKVLALLVFLACVAVAGSRFSMAMLTGLIAAGLFLTKVPVRVLAGRFLFIVPVPALFATVVWVSGHSDRAGILLSRSILSLAGILLTVTSTPIARFFAALTWAKVPGLLVEVVQFVYRYLFVLAEEVWTIRQAAASRGGSGSLIAAVSGVSVLFARSYSRAEAIHRAMVSRSFSGSLVTSLASTADYRDVVFVAVVVSWSLASVMLTHRF